MTFVLLQSDQMTTAVVNQWEQMSSVLDRFDFDKIRKMMIVTDWKWGGPFMNGEFGTPTVDAMRSQCTQLMLEAYRKEATVSAGGFEAVWVPATQKVILRFVAAVCY
jgi:hypothetical protein